MIGMADGTAEIPTWIMLNTGVGKRSAVLISINFARLVFKTVVNAWHSVLFPIIPRASLRNCLDKASFKDSLYLCGMFYWFFSGGSVYESCTTFRAIHKQRRGSRYHPAGINYKRWTAQKKCDRERVARPQETSSELFFVEMWSCDPYQEIVFMFYSWRTLESGHENGQRPSLRRKLEFNGAAVGILMNFSNVSRAEFHFRSSKHDGRQLIRIVAVNDAIQTASAGSQSQALYRDAEGIDPMLDLR